MKRTLLTTALLMSGLAQAAELEVLHRWTSGGEAKAATALKAMMQAKGHVWKDIAVAGGGDGAAMTVLRSLVDQRQCTSRRADQGPQHPGMGA